MTLSAIFWGVVIFIAGGAAFAVLDELFPRLFPSAMRVVRRRRWRDRRSA